MAEFAGIKNENEFYFAHYLSSLMDDELKEICQSDTLKASQDRVRKLVGKYHDLREIRQAITGKRISALGDLKEEYRRLRANFVEEMANALGYFDVFRRGVLFPCENLTIPVSGVVFNGDGHPQVVLIESYYDFNSIGSVPEVSLLGNPLSQRQLDVPDLPEASRRALDPAVVGKGHADKAHWESLISSEIFSGSQAPRFVVVFGENAILLADRTKWAERRTLIFDLDEIYDRGENATFRALAALLHRESLAPNGSTSLPDRLDENSHKNAFGVSKSLRYAMREAIELLGNAILETNPAARTVTEEGTANNFSAAELSKECIIVMYRFLFILFLESRKDLGYFERVGGKGADDVFASAYGFDHLRDLETVPLLTDADRNGHYFDASIKQLFSKIWNGFPAPGIEGTAVPDGKDAFRLKPLKAHLFDPKRTELFNAARITNVVWQKIIYSLSIGEAGTGRRKRKGRISYAQLGIQQLGAVYEALLSYTGFYAKEDLYEVCNAGVKGGVADTGSEETDDESAAEDAGDAAESGAKADVFETGYFVTAKELETYRPEERVTDPENPGHYVCHRKGTFIYRMAGRDRERSASYYTPAELTRCLVRQAIAERVKPEMTSQEIMQLTVCEPAMGSAAFLNEMVDQLADIYLKRAQEERKVLIPIERYAAEKARVKMVIADRNVYGVDLNPMAADLAEVSLWLGTVGGEKLPTGRDSDEPYIPWFGTQLKCGNSIIGARREVVFRDGRHEKVDFGKPLPQGGVWHFLLPDAGMAPKLDKVVSELVGKDVVQKFKDWGKTFQLPDRKKAKTATAFENLWRRLVRLTSVIDALWNEAADEMKELDELTLDDVAYFGYTPNSPGVGDIEFKDQQLSLAQSQNAKSLAATSAYFRLKSIMDLNCALWFWPLDASSKLPSYEDFLLVAQLLAKKDLSGTIQQLTLDLGEEDVLTDAEKDARISAFRATPTLDRLHEAFPFTKVAQSVARRQRFLHWELEFAPIFKEHGGFDLTIGNPPWVKLQWNEQGILSEYDPHIVVRKISANDTMALRSDVFRYNQGACAAYLREYAETSGTKSFLGASANYPSLAGVQTNLFKFFLPLAFRIVNDNGVSAYIHPEGVYDDPNGSNLRSEIYQRLRLHAQFVNELKLFDIDHHVTYGLNVYGPARDKVDFCSVAKLFHPATLIESLSCRGDTSDDLPLERTEGGSWNLSGHPDRVVHVDIDNLTLFAKLYDEPGTAPLTARLPSLYTGRFLTSILNTINSIPSKMADEKYGVYECWHETNSQKDGTIRRKPAFVESTSKLVYSGPLFSVANPISKTARQNARVNSDFDLVDLTAAEENYRVRTIYQPALSPEEYSKRVSAWDGQKIFDCWRVVCRGYVSVTSTAERSLMPILVPKGMLHINTVVEYVANELPFVVKTAGAWASLPYDWFYRTMSKPRFLNNVACLLPVLPDNMTINSRTLLLNCLNRDYAELWHDAWNDSYRFDRWLSSDPHLTKWADHFASGKEWTWGTPLRTQLDRRQALVELDVIVTKALGLSLDDLLLMYRVSFPTMRKYDADTYYDQNGRCVFSAKSGESYVPRKATKKMSTFSVVKDGVVLESNTALGWEDMQARYNEPGYEIRLEVVETVFSDEPTARTITYVAPFYRKDREADYREAWEMLAAREQVKA